MLLGKSPHSTGAKPLSEHDSTEAESRTPH
ncbi:hypothetical protein WCLP8_3940014 [uncultured Gammaproteobacteria bacterium]